MIPKIIHQIYWDFYGNSKEIPEKWKNYHNTWKEKFPEPEYTHILWDYDKCRNLIKENYKWFLTTFDNYPKHIQRVDSARYFILYHHGGIYADLDCECRENFYTDLDQVNINVAGNPYGGVVGMNNLMASNKKNKKWLSAFKELEKRKKNVATLLSTGPKVLGSLTDKNIKILDLKEFNPLKERSPVWYYIENKFFVKLDKENMKTWDTAKVVHHGDESWKYEEAYCIIKFYVIPILIILCLLYKMKKSFITSSNSKKK